MGLYRIFRTRNHYIVIKRVIRWLAFLLVVSSTLVVFAQETTLDLRASDTNEEIYSQLFFEGVYQLPKVTASVSKGANSGCSCLEYVKSRRGITGVLVSPKAIYKKGGTYKVFPSPGFIGVTNEGNFYHAFYTEEVDQEEGTITFLEVNFPLGNCKPTRRTLKIDDSRILGYF